MKVWLSIWWDSFLCILLLQVGFCAMGANHDGWLVKAAAPIQGKWDIFVVEVALRGFSASLCVRNVLPVC